MKNCLACCARKIASGKFVLSMMLMNMNSAVKRLTTLLRPRSVMYKSFSYVFVFNISFALIIILLESNSRSTRSIGKRKKFLLRSNMHSTIQIFFSRFQSQMVGSKRKMRNSKDDLIGCLLAPYLLQMEVPRDFGITFHFIRHEIKASNMDLSDVQKIHSEHCAVISPLSQFASKEVIKATNLMIEARFNQDKLNILQKYPRTILRDERVHQLRVYDKKLRGCYMELVRTPLEMMVALNMVLMQHSIII